jgi:nucleotide-binding universal stress UspA family protein
MLHGTGSFQSQSGLPRVLSPVRASQEDWTVDLSKTWRWNVQFSEVVVPLDLVRPADAVIGVASALASRAGVGVRLITVSSPRLDHTADLVDLRALAEKLPAPSVAVEVIESNDVVPALLERAGPDGLLCLETRAHGPLAAIVLGGTASELLQATPRPVLLVGPATDPDVPLGLIEVCLELSEAATALLPVVATWGRDLDLRLRFVHAVAGHELRHGGVEAAEELARVASRAREDFGAHAETDLLVGRSAPEAIVDDVARHRASIVAVAVRRRSRLRRSALGSVALAVAHATRASVLAVPVLSHE